MDNLKLTFVNVGYGEAIIICCPDPSYENGQFIMLIDGGSAEASEYADRASGRTRLSEYLADHPLGHIDVMVSTHIHEDHTGGLVGILPHPKEFWQTLPSDLYKKLGHFPEDLHLLSSRKFSRSVNDFRLLGNDTEKSGGLIRQITSDTRPAELCHDFKFEVLSPTKAESDALADDLIKLSSLAGKPTFEPNLIKTDGSMNNKSMILLLTFGQTRILLPGDTSASGFLNLSKEIHADLFKIGHHGQVDSMTESLADRIMAKHIVCCASSDRRYQSADPRVMDMLRNKGASLWFSDCPKGQAVHPHRALMLEVEKSGNIHGYYELSRKAETAGTH